MTVYMTYVGSVLSVSNKNDGALCVGRMCSAIRLYKTLSSCLDVMPPGQNSCVSC